MSETESNNPPNTQLTEKKLPKISGEEVTSAEVGSISQFDFTELEDGDPVLTHKMFLVNNAIDEIGFTWYHFKMFVLNGMGYAVDSMIGQLQGTVASQVNLQFGQVFPGAALAVYVGLLVGAIAWGFSADIIGRRVAFNSSLLLGGILTIVTGAMPSYISYAAFVALSNVAEGGNLILDTTIFLEFLPFKYQWLLSFMALWWGVGQAITVLIAWPFMVNFSCADAETCTNSNNKGWRYTWYVNGGFILLCGLARITVIRLMETPKFNLTNGRDDLVVRDLQKIAADSGRTCSLTLEDLQACGKIKAFEDGHVRSPWYARVGEHIRMLFANRKMALSTGMIFFSWAAIGLIYPLYSVFLPSYLASRGAQTGDSSVNTTYKNLAISNVVAIGGPILGALSIHIPKWGPIPAWGRRGAMASGAFLSMIFMFAYTGVRTGAENLAFSCVIFVTLDWYYGVLYAYTPEVFPSSCRATGNAAAVSCNRILAITAPLVAFYGNTSTSVPIYVMAALFGVMAVVSLLFPFEPSGRRTV